MQYIYIVLFESVACQYRKSSVILAISFSQKAFKSEEYTIKITLTMLNIQTSNFSNYFSRTERLVNSC